MRKTQASSRKNGSRARRKAEVLPFPDPPQPDVPPDFPVVAIGASAGGLEAVLELLEAVPERPNMAFVVIVHQEPTHTTMVPSILERAVKMPVRLIEDDQAVEANHIYVAPPQADLTIREGVLSLVARESSRRMPIDAFLIALAEDMGSRAVAVILSGSASDGAQGSKAIKVEGGIVFAQDRGARFASMPQAAVAAGAVDFVLPPREIARELERIAASIGRAAGRLPEADLLEVFALLQAA